MVDPLNDSSAKYAPSRRDMLKVGLGTGGALFFVFGLPTLAQRLQPDPTGGAAEPTLQPSLEPHSCPTRSFGFRRADPSP